MSALSAVFEIILILAFAIIIIYFVDPSLLKQIIPFCLPNLCGPLYTPMGTVFKYPADYIGQNVTTSGVLVNTSNATYVLTDVQGDYMELHNLTLNVQWVYGDNYTVHGVFWQAWRRRASGCIEVYQNYTQVLNCTVKYYYMIVHNATRLPVS